jgi:ubiquitin carboxyl-terminal hydrolase 7
VDMDAEERKRHCATRNDFSSRSSSSTSNSSQTSIKLSPPVAESEQPQPLQLQLQTNSQPSLLPYSSSLSASSLSLSAPRSPVPLMDFKPTHLPIVAEGEYVWTVAEWKQQVSAAREALDSEAAGFHVSPLRSPTFEVGGEEWRLQLQLTEDNASVSLFVAIANGEELKRARGTDWAVCAEIILAMEAEVEVSSGAEPALVAESFCHSQCSYHRFNEEEGDWGFRRFCPVSSVTGARDVRVIGRIRVVRDVSGVLWHNFNRYDSKQVTGYVGLENQGATCYMNSFLQSLFLTNAFRAAVYRIPTAEAKSSESIPLALQRIFYQLQTSSLPPRTNELTASFGWGMSDSFQQHDVQEFSRVLLDDLESAMKSSEVEGTVERLFRGKLRNVIRCTNVSYESVRSESFYDLQMTIRGVRSLEESFEKYVAVEVLNGKNQYRTESFGLQDAEKFIVFEHLPPVLHVHLERYAFDLHTGSIVKVHDRFEFPLELDLSKYMARDNVVDAQRPEDQQFWLHSVLVHSGSGYGGHYYVYIRHPSNPDRWFKFDDTTVLPCTVHEAVNENFGSGGASEPVDGNELLRSTGMRVSRLRSYTSAYLLVYIRKCDLSTVMAPVEEAKIPEVLAARLKDEEEAERKRRLEWKLMAVNVVTEAQVAEHRGADLFDPENPQGLVKIPKDSTVSALVPSSDDYEVYSLVPRRNKTVRPDTLIPLDDVRPLSALGSRIAGGGPVAFFLRQVAKGAHGGADAWKRPLVPEQGAILLYVKWFDGAGELKPLGALVVDANAPISVLEAPIRTRLSLPETAELALYEELKPSRITLLDGTRAFLACNMRQGDIVIAGLAAAAHTPIDYFEGLTSWLGANVREIGSHEDEPEPVSLQISTKWRYAELVESVARAANVPSQKVPFLRLGLVSGENTHSAVSVSVDAPKPTNSVHFWRSDHVADATVADLLRPLLGEQLNGNAASPAVVLGWELTPVPVKEAEKTLMRYWIEAGLGLSEELAAALPRAVYLPRFVGTVSDLLCRLDAQPSADSLRLLECHEGKIKRVYAPGTANELLTPINPDTAALFLEARAEDEQSGAEDDERLDANRGKLISVFCYERALSRPHSIPTKFCLLPEEPLSALRKRLARRLALSANALATAQLSLVSWGRERVLEEEQTVLWNVPALGEEDQLAVQVPDPLKAARRVSANTDGAIRFRKSSANP